MQSAYRSAGISIPRVTTNQVDAGKAVNDATLPLPGDLVFTPGRHGTMANPRHVRIHLG